KHIDRPTHAGRKRAGLAGALERAMYRILPPSRTDELALPPDSVPHGDVGQIAIAAYLSDIAGSDRRDRGEERLLDPDSCTRQEYLDLLFGEGLEQRHRDHHVEPAVVIDGSCISDLQEGLCLGFGVIDCPGTVIKAPRV